jgi:hypothetical protein
MRYSLSDDQRADLEREFTRMEQEHRDLDDQLQIQRLKKRKLMLKDQLLIISDKLRPDIIA